MRIELGEEAPQIVGVDEHTIGNDEPFVSQGVLLAVPGVWNQARQPASQASIFGGDVVAVSFEFLRGKEGAFESLVAHVIGQRQSLTHLVGKFCGAG